MSISKRYLVSRIILLVIGALMGAVGVVMFLLPNNIAPAGLSGIGVILNELIGVSVGLVIIIGNIPIQMLAYRELFGWRAVLPTAFAVVVYSLAIDFLPTLVNIETISDDLLLNAIFGGAITGLGGGLVYRAGGSFGGTSTLARILRRRYGLSLGTASIFTDVIVLVGAGLVFGWEAALYALIGLFISRSVSDYILDGSGHSYTALIISQKSKEVSRAIKEVLQHQIMSWDVGNDANDEKFRLLMVSISRPEAHGLRQLLQEVDTNAYMTVLETHATYGKEFQQISSSLPLEIDEVDDATSRYVQSSDIEKILSE